MPGFKRPARVSRAAAGLVLLLPAAGAAQMRASERASVSQTLDGTTITVEYGRPRARGRELFGSEVPWGKVWTGANWATTIDVNRDITIGGRPLHHGRYSVWLQVQPGDWTAIFDREPHRFHTNPPAETSDQVRFPVTPGTGPRVETLTWSFPEYRATATTLQMAWGTTTVSLPIEVQSSRPLTVTAEFASRYTGTFRLAPRDAVARLPGRRHVLPRRARGRQAVRCLQRSGLRIHTHRRTGDAPRAARVRRSVAGHRGARALNRPRASPRTSPGRERHRPIDRVARLRLRGPE